MTNLALDRLAVAVLTQGRMRPASKPRTPPHTHPSERRSPPPRLGLVEPRPTTWAPEEPSTVLTSTCASRPTGSSGDILGQLIPGHGDLPADNPAEHPAQHPADELAPDAALMLRWQYAVTIAGDVQARLCAAGVTDGSFDPSDESEHTLTVLFHDRTIVLEDLDAWDRPDVPLVLVTTDYHPYTERPPVAGNVRWVDPSTVTALVSSLVRLGVIQGDS